MFSVRIFLKTVKGRHFIFRYIWSPWCWTGAGVGQVQGLVRCTNKSHYWPI